VVEVVSDPLADPLSSDIVPMVEIQSPDEVPIPSVVDSIVELSITNPTTSTLAVQPSSLVNVGTVEIVTVDVHAAWDAAESPLPDPVGDTEAQ